MVKRPKVPTEGQRALLARDTATPSTEGYGRFTTAAPVDPALSPPDRVRQAMLNAAAVQPQFEWVAGFEDEYLDTREELEKRYQRSRQRDGKLARAPWDEHAQALRNLSEQKHRWAIRLQVVAAQRELDRIWREVGDGPCPVPRWDDQYTPVLDRATLHRIVQAAHPEITENAARWFRESVAPVVDVEQFPGKRESLRINIRMLRDAFPNVDEAALLAPPREKNRRRREKSDVAPVAKPSHRRATRTK